jgi:hypothetical protein
MKNKLNRIVKIWCYSWTGLFIIFALLQYNDQDPEIWMTWYLLAAAIHYSFIFKRLPLMMVLIYILLAIAWSILQWPETFDGFIQDEPHNENVEKARESAGLLLTGLVSICSLLFLRKQY